MSTSPSGSERLSLLAAALMVLLTASWGLQQASVKLVLAEVPPFAQNALRAAIGSLVVVAYAAIARRPLRARGTLLPGILLGIFFATEFLLLYEGLTLTSASRSVLFFYSSPFFVAMLSAWLLPEERLGAAQVAGLLLAFAGMGLAIGMPPPAGPDAHLGDAMAVVAAFLWACSTVLVKRSALRTAPPESVLLYQLVATVVLGTVLMLARGEAVRWPPPPLAAGIMAYQGVWVAGLTYLVWFVLLKRYPAGPLSTFTILTPVFGVAAGHLLLGEPLTPAFVAAVALVAAGLWLVYARPRRIDRAAKLGQVKEDDTAEAA